jgi:hypothetical protein
MLSLGELLKASEGFLTRFPNGSQVTWKLLSIKQYEALRGLVASGILSEHEARHEAFAMVVLDNTIIYQEFPAGYIDALGALVLWYSGDCNSQTLRNDLNQLRQAFTGQTPHEHMVTVITTAYPALTIDDVESWSRNKLLRIFVRAEHALHFRLGDAFQYLDPKNIVFAGEETPNKMGVDFDSEIAEMREQGIVANAWGVSEDHEIEQLDRWQRKLSAEQARALDRRR